MNSKALCFVLTGWVLFGIGACDTQTQQSDFGTALEEGQVSESEEEVNAKIAEAQEAGYTLSPVSRPTREDGTQATFTISLIFGIADINKVFAIYRDANWTIKLPGNGSLAIPLSNKSWWFEFLRLDSLK